MKQITADMLREKRACKEQVALFERLFPNGAAFRSEKAAVRAAEKVADRFDWTWAARHLLTPSMFVEYEKARAPLWVEHEKVTAPLFARLWWNMEEAK